MEIKSAEFVKGVIGDDYSMGDERPQIAFLGRSNVGKSSVINSLLKRKSLVRSSSTPGKTREANYFLINDEFYCVDFPGYGYARVSHKERDRIIKRILWYLQFSNVKPVLAILVIDIKVGFTEHDEEMLEILMEHNHEVLVVANKSDKLNQADLSQKIRSLTESGLEADIKIYSAKTGKGADQIWEHIEYMIENGLNNEDQEGE